MIGLKSIAALAISLGLVVIAALRGVLDASYLEHLSGAAAFAVGLVASAALGLVAAAWRPDVRSRSALALRRGRTTVVDVASATSTAGAGSTSAPGASSLDAATPETAPAGDSTAMPTPTAAAAAAAAKQVEVPRARELPGVVQRAMLLAGFIAVALGALTNHAAARIAELRDRWSEPSPSEYCLPEAPKPKTAEPEPPPPEVVEQQGCALVRRAFVLGYAKSLGSCAPKTVAAAIPKPAVVTREACTRRQLDEPFLHYGARRVAHAITETTSPIDAAEQRVDDIRTHVDYLDSLVADIRHAITGTPHAAHHIWTNLPDPHPPKLRERFVGAPRCSTRFASLPLWPHFDASDPDSPSQLVEHVLGQLLFATRFGSTASCNDYVIHWDAPADACAHPDALLADRGVRDVLDRRRRQVDLGALAKALGRSPPPPPPPIAAIVSLQCFVVAPGSSPSAPSTPSTPATITAPTVATTTIDGEALAVRSMTVTNLRVDADGPIDVYIALATLLGGDARFAGSIDITGSGGAAPAPTGETTGDDFMLARLDALAATDPFSSHAARAELARADVADVYPIERHLHAFIDAFRRRYLAQRGRL